MRRSSRFCFGLPSAGVWLKNCSRTISWSTIRTAGPSDTNWQVNTLFSQDLMSTRLSRSTAVFWS